MFPIHPLNWCWFARSRLIPTGLLVLLAALSAGFCLSAHAAPVKIVVTGDGRAEYPWNPVRSCDRDGLNFTVNTAIAKAVLSEGASILIWTGDIANINDANDDALEARLKKWREIMAPLYSNKVKVWPVRGNHEVYRYLSKDNSDGELIPNATAVWKRVFSGAYAIRATGKSDDGLSFYSVEGPALIIGLDQYGGAQADPLRRKHLVNQQWLDRVLSQHHRQSFTFVYGHEAAFMAGRHKDDDTLAADIYARNVFWQSLVKSGATYLCGHDHFYDRMSVARNGPKPGREVFQITAGTAGAPCYKSGSYADSTLWKLTRVQNFPDVWGYILLEVDSDKATMTFKAVR